jgi:hypothetical protein
MPDWMQEVKNACSVHSLLEKVFDAFSVLTVNLKNLPEEYKKPKTGEVPCTRSPNEYYPL